MGIGGITYTDGQGRRRAIEAADLDDFKRRFSPLSPRARLSPPLPQPAAAPQAPAAMPGASVVQTPGGLALRGEERDPLVAGKKIYASVDGRKGWHTLDEVDPVPGGGARVGAPAGCDDPDPVEDHRDKPDGTPWTTGAVSRLRFDIDAGIATLTEFSKDFKMTPGSRVGGVSEERAREIASWPVALGGRTQHAFDIERTDNGLKIVRCVFSYDGHEQQIADTALEARAGGVFLVKDEKDVFSISRTPPGGETEKTQFVRLYDLDEDGGIITDWRHASLQLYEQDEPDDLEVDAKLALRGGGDSAQTGQHWLDLTVSLMSGETVISKSFTSVELPVSGSNYETGGDADSGVKSLNALQGVLRIIGGKGVVVTTNKDKKFIKITWDPNKDTDDEAALEEKNDDGCSHPDTDDGGVPSDNGGGYNVNGKGGEDWHGGYPPTDGGVNADGGETAEDGGVTCCD